MPEMSDPTLKLLIEANTVVELAKDIRDDYRETMRQLMELVRVADIAARKLSRAGSAKSEYAEFLSAFGYGPTG